MKLKKLLIITIISSFSSAAFAHHEGAIAGPGIAGPIITIPARTLPRGRAFLGTGIKYTHWGNFGPRKTANLARRGETTGQINESMNLTLSGGYGITDDLDIYLSIPYTFKYDLIETDGGEISNFGDSIGLGDITLLSQYRFLKLEEKGFYASLLGGVTIPVGQTEVVTDQGDKFGLDDQPGSGSWDPLFGVAMSKNLGPLSLDSNFLFRLSNEGPRNSTVGDTVNYNAALSYRIDRHRHLNQEGKEHNHLSQDDSRHTHSHDLKYHSHKHSHTNGHEHDYSHNYSYVGRKLAQIFPSKLLGQDLVWDLISEVNYNWQERPEVGDLEEQNHGGHIIFATEGVRAIINEKLVANLGVQLPVIKGLNGAQPDPEVSVLFNLSWLF